VSNEYFVCVTTIQSPTPAMRELYLRVEQTGGRLVVAGDIKGPMAYVMNASHPSLADGYTSPSFSSSNNPPILQPTNPQSNVANEFVDFLSLSDQLSAGFALSELLPTGHYARKNIAYLHAIRSGAKCIYETDDDNAPLPSWRPRTEIVASVRKIEPVSGPQEFRGSERSPQWINVYRYFSGDLDIWPRGFPLNEIRNDVNLSACQPSSVSGAHAPVQQGLVNGSPDVDAVWRLTQDRPFEFDNRSSLWLAPGQWCPFNTQSTWWWPVAYPLLYIPSHCSFRMSDIWKSFVAQRCLWAMGFGVVFHAPEVVQERNEHNLMKDFADELPGYLQNARIAEVLEWLELASGANAVGDNLHRCYEALIGEGIFPKEEAVLVEKWLEDVASTITG